MTPRLASWALDRQSFCRGVFHTTVEKWLQLPVQWRGFVLHGQSPLHTVDATLDMLSRNPDLTKLDPQGVFDAYNGHSPS